MAKTGATTYSISFYQKDGAFVSDRTVDLNGKVLAFNGGGNNILVLDPVTFGTEIGSNDGTGNTGLSLNANVVGGDVFFRLKTDNGTNEVKIEGDAIAQTLTLTADNGTIINNLSGNGAGVVAVDNNGLLSWSAAGGSFGYPQILLAQVFS